MASVSGDLRRAMEISSLILESNEKITIESVVQIMKQMLVTPQIKAIECCSRLEQLFLEAVLNQVYFDDVSLHYKYVINLFFFLVGKTCRTFATIKGPIPGILFDLHNERYRNAVEVDISRNFFEIGSDAINFKR